MTLELRAMVRRLATKGLGWEDICHELGINNALVRATVRELTLFHVKHVQPGVQSKQEDRPMAS